MTEYFVEKVKHIELEVITDSTHFQVFSKWHLILLNGIFYENYHVDCKNTKTRKFVWFLLFMFWILCTQRTKYRPVMNNNNKQTQIQTQTISNEIKLEKFSFFSEAPQHLSIYSGIQKLQTKIIKRFLISLS